MPALHLAIQPQEGGIADLELVLPDDERRPVRALVDTGAKTSLVDTNLARELGLPRDGTIELITPSGRGPTPAYRAGIVMAMPGFETEFSNLRLAGADLAGQPAQVLLGRDVLDRLTLVYDGPARRMSLFI